jgi:hypothetical protein
MAKTVTFIKKGIDTIDCSFDNPTAPPKDERFSSLLNEAYDGRCPLYQADVPLSLIRTYEEHAGITRSPVRAEFIETVSSQLAREIETDGDYPWIHVYPLDSYYVASDDYCSLAAYQRLNAPEVKCIVYGFPSVPGTRNVRGPAPQPQVYKVLGVKPR